MVLLHWGFIYWHCYTGEWCLYAGIASLVSVPYMLGFLYWWSVPRCCWHCYTGEWSLYVGIATLVSGPICWHCYTGEWSLHCGIAILMIVPRWWYCDTEVLYIGIAILVSGAYMLVLLHWWEFPTCWDCYTGEWSLYVGIATLVSCPICWHCYTGDWSLHVGIAILKIILDQLC